MGILSLALALVLSGASGDETSAAPGKPPLHEHATLVRMLEENNRLRASVGLSPQQMSPAVPGQRCVLPVAVEEEGSKHD